MDKDTYRSEVNRILHEYETDKYRISYMTSYFVKDMENKYGRYSNLDVWPNPRVVIERFYKYKENLT